MKKSHSEIFEVSLKCINLLLVKTHHRTEKYELDLLHGRERSLRAKNKFQHAKKKIDFLYLGSRNKVFYDFRYSGLIENTNSE